MNKVKRLLPIILVMVMVLSVAACGPTDTPTTTPTPTPDAGGAATPTPETQTDPSTDENEPQYGGTYVHGMSVSPTGLFYINQAGSARQFTTMCVEMLGRYDPETTFYEPFLAESWESSVEDKTFTINLPEGVLFHDGSELTGEVLKWNLEYMIECGQGSLIGNPIKIEATGDYQVVCHFEKFALDWPDKFGIVMVTSKYSFDTYGEEWMQTHPVGTGPFVFDEYVPDNYISYVRNDNYRMEGLPYLDGYRMQTITEWSAMMTAFNNGEIHSFNCGDQATALELIAMGHQPKQEPTPGGYTLFCIYPNSKIESDPFYDVRVRQAVFLFGTDWEAVSILSGGGQFSRTSIQAAIPGSLFYNEELEKESYYDLDKAKQMLADAGYADGFNTTIYAANVNLPAATAFQAELKNLNINAEIVEITFSDTVRWDASKPGLCMNNGYSAHDYVTTPIGVWYNPYSTSYGNNMKFSDEFAEIYDAAVSATTWEERIDLGKQLVRMLTVDECLHRTMYMTINSIFINDNAIGSGYELNSATPELTWFKN